MKNTDNNKLANVKIIVDGYLSTNKEKLTKSRQLVLKIADYIIPGHGPMFKTNFHPAGGSW